MKIYLTSIFSFFILFTSSAQTYNIVDFGAKGDSLTLNTKAIQSAIDECSKQGGGEVIIPKGIFLTGSLHLSSRVKLFLTEGSVLLGSINFNDYHIFKRWPALLYAENADSLSITGKGTINGRGRELALAMDSLYWVGILKTSFYDRGNKRLAEQIRPQILQLISCNNINISGINIQNSACWVQTYIQCRNLSITHVNVNSDSYWNNDGIDIVDCKHVRISDCFVNVADDGICLKSESKDGFNDDVVIEKCTVRSSASAVKFGTASVGGFRNVTIKNIKVFDTYRSAVALECVDGGFLTNVLVDGIEAKNTGNAIFIKLGHRNSSKLRSIDNGRYINSMGTAEQNNNQVGNIENIVIKNVKVEVPFGKPDIDYELRGPDLPFFHNIIPASITGIPGYPVKNIKLENIEISYPGRGNKGLAYVPLYKLDSIPERFKNYPEFTMFGELPSWGMYGRHIDGITFQNISLSAEEKDSRPSLVFDDVQNLDMKKVKINEKNADKNKKQIVVKQTTFRISDMKNNDIEIL